MVLDGEKQSQLNKKKIYSSLRKEGVLNYWKNHNTFRIRDERTISWNILGRATRLLPPGIQRQHIKFITGHIGNYYMMHKRGEIESNKCSNCNCNAIEKSSHILVCTNQKAKEFYLTKINVDLRKELEAKQTSPTLIITLLDILRNWRRNNPINISNFDRSSLIGKAITEQQKIGWNNFVIGRWSKVWEKVQHEYYLSINSQRTSFIWAISIIKKFLLINWEVWDFRNELIHGKGGKIDRARNKELSFQIRQQFLIGSAELRKEDKYLFKNKYNLPSLLNRPIDEKRQWLTSVQNARSALEMEEETEEEQTTTEPLIQQQLFRYYKRNNNNNNNNNR